MERGVAPVQHLRLWLISHLSVVIPTATCSYLDTNLAMTRWCRFDCCSGFVVFQVMFFDRWSIGRWLELVYVCMFSAQYRGEPETRPSWLHVPTVMFSLLFRKTTSFGCTLEGDLTYSWLENPDIFSRNPGNPHQSWGVSFSRKPINHGQSW